MMQLYALPAMLPRLRTRFGWPGRFVREGASSRLIAAMAEIPPIGRRQGVAAGGTSPYSGDAIESDAQYFSRRSAEERRAADTAAGPEARSAHEELATHYSRLSKRVPTPPVSLATLLSRRFGLSAGVVRSQSPRRLPSQSVGASAVQRKRRLDERLDRALLETFPASDPISFSHVR